MPLIMSGLASYWVIMHAESLKKLGLIEQFIVWGILAVAMGLSLIPTTFVALIAGYIWGWSAIIPLVISYSIASWLGNRLSKWVDNDQILLQINQSIKARKLIASLHDNQFKIVALARLSPIFPFGISNVIFTYLGVPIRTLLTAGILGMLPRTLFMVWIASKAESIKAVLENNWKSYLTSPIFYLGIFSIILLVIVVYKALKPIKNH